MGVITVEDFKKETYIDDELIDNWLISIMGSFSEGSGYSYPDFCCTNKERVVFVNIGFIVNTYSDYQFTGIYLRTKQRRLKPCTTNQNTSP